MAQDTRIERIRRRGRTLGILVFAAIVASFTLVCTIQICLQVWAPRIEQGPVDCRAGVLELYRALEQARQAAAREAGEQAALRSFRDTLATSWKREPAVARACASDPMGQQALRELSRLRYAEEHAVRYEASELAAQRRHVERLIPALNGAEPLSHRPQAETGHRTN